MSRRLHIAPTHVCTMTRGGNSVSTIPVQIYWILNADAQHAAVATMLCSTLNSYQWLSEGASAMEHCLESTSNDPKPELLQYIAIHAQTCKLSLQMCKDQRSVCANRLTFRTQKHGLFCTRIKISRKENGRCSDVH